MRSGIITLTTDFGLDDTFVGQMKGVIVGTFPGARVVDLTHGIPRQDTGAAAFALETGFGAFPAGTVHLVVVDPGVGTTRRAVAVAAGGHVFVGPDNGVLARVLRRVQIETAHAIDNPDILAERISATFHGRDVFAPAAARLASGLGLAELGPAVDPATLAGGASERDPLLEAGRVPVLAVDRFGNLTLDVREDELRAALGNAGPPKARIAGTTVEGLSRTYADVAPGAPLLLIGSAGYLELAVHLGSAAERFAVRPGDEVELFLV